MVYVGFNADDVIIFSIPAGVTTFASNINFEKQNAPVSFSFLDRHLPFVGDCFSQLFRFAYQNNDH